MCVDQLQHIYGKENACQGQMTDMNWDSMLASMLDLSHTFPSAYDKQPLCFHLSPLKCEDPQSVFNPAGPSAGAPKSRIPGLRPNAFCSRTNPSVILRDDDFDSEHAILNHVREALTDFDVLMTGPNQQRDANNNKHHYMAHAARFKAQELMLLADAMEEEANNNQALSEVHHMRRAWLVGRIDRAMNLCWYENQRS